VRVVPSAAVWLRARESAVVARPGAVLSLADPPGALTGTGDERGSSDDVWARLGPLRDARAEARQFVRRFGGASMAWAGAEATEHRLARTPLDRFGTLHIAAHAVVDEEHPQRSAVVLAAGGGEDGLLQVAEIVRLRLAGKLVVLSACRSASGRVLAGEGPLGLTRAFLEAEARAVVGSLWPLRDDEARRAMSLLADRLARGEPVGAALAGVRRALHRSGAPAAVWSGLVVVGDGDAVVASAAKSARSAGLLARRRRARFGSR
jgi:CHAT domain-containing protein